MNLSLQPTFTSSRFGKTLFPNDLNGITGKQVKLSGNDQVYTVQHVGLPLQALSYEIKLQPLHKGGDAMQPVTLDMVSLSDGARQLRTLSDQTLSTHA